MLLHFASRFKHLPSLSALRLVCLLIAISHENMGSGVLGIEPSFLTDGLPHFPHTGEEIVEIEYVGYFRT